MALAEVRGDTTLREQDYIRKDYDPLSYLPRVKELLEPGDKVQYPLIKWLNIRTFAGEVTRHVGQRTIGHYPREVWDSVADGTDAIWFTAGLYPCGPLVRAAAQRPVCMSEYREFDPGVTKETVTGSAFAISEYTPDPNLARNWHEVDKVHTYLNKKGVRLYLDFILHFGLDTNLVYSHPDMFIEVTEEIGKDNDYEYFPVRIDGETRYFAKSRDPNYGPYYDCLQLNYAVPEAQDFMIRQVLSILEHCDGVRCDMAMLANPETFLHTWGWLMTDEEKTFMRRNNFWEKVRNAADSYFGQGKKKLIAESYNIIHGIDDMGILSRAGFDWLYGKNDFYDRLARILASEIHPEDLYRRLKVLEFQPEFLNKLLTFIGTHDDMSLAYRFGSLAGRAALSVTGFLPGAFLMKHGEEKGGRLQMKVHLSTEPHEAEDRYLSACYETVRELRSSRIMQEGGFSVPERWGGNAYNIIPMQYAFRDIAGMTIITNLHSGDEAKGKRRDTGRTAFCSIRFNERIMAS